MAVLTSGWAGGVVADCGLGGTVLGGLINMISNALVWDLESFKSTHCIATVLVSILWRRETAPVDVSQEATFRFEANGLSQITSLYVALSVTSGINRRAKVGKRQFHWNLPDVECHGRCIHGDITWD